MHTVLPIRLALAVFHIRISSEVYQEKNCGKERKENGRTCVYIYIYMINKCSSKTMQEMLQLQSSADSTLAMAVLAAQICLILSITTTDCDCAISTVRRVKSRLRSEMKSSTTK